MANSHGHFWGICPCCNTKLWMTAPDAGREIALQFWMQAPLGQLGYMFRYGDEGITPILNGVPVVDEEDGYEVVIKDARDCEMFCVDHASARWRAEIASAEIGPDESSYGLFEGRCPQTNCHTKLWMTIPRNGDRVSLEDHPPLEDMGYTVDSFAVGEFFVPRLNDQLIEERGRVVAFRDSEDAQGFCIEYARASWRSFVERVHAVQTSGERQGTGSDAQSVSSSDFPF